MKIVNILRNACIYISTQTYAVVASFENESNKAVKMLFKRIMKASLNREKTHLRRYKYFKLHAGYVQYKGN